MYRYGEENLELTLWGSGQRSAVRAVLLHRAGQAAPGPERTHSRKVFSHRLSDDLLWIKEKVDAFTMSALATTWRCTMCMSHDMS